MRVFVPRWRRRRPGGDQQAIFAHAAASARRCGTCGPACRRSRTCSPRRVRRDDAWSRADRCRSTTRVTAATAAASASPGGAWPVIAGGRHQHDAAQAGVPRAAAVRRGCRSSSARSRSTPPPTRRRRLAFASTAQTFREFLEQQDFFVFFITDLRRRRPDRQRPARQRAADLPVQAADADRVHLRQAGGAVRRSCCW